MAAWILPLLAFSGALKAEAAQMDAEDRALTLEDEAQAAIDNAVIARRAGKYNAERTKILGEKIMGGIKADYAASGISSDSLSALEVLRESHTNAELDRQNILFGAEMRAQGFEKRARSATAGAARSREAGRLNAFASLFGTGADIASRY